MNEEQQQNMIEQARKAAQEFAQALITIKESVEAFAEAFAQMTDDTAPPADGADVDPVCTHRTTRWFKSANGGHRKCMDCGELVVDIDLAMPEVDLGYGQTEE